MSSHVNGNKANGVSNGIDPKITFYTNHACPWAHRSAITLHALNLPYDEEIIPLDRPRSAEYLAINPRGLVPAIKISNGILEDEIIAESAIVSTFLADAFPQRNEAFWPKSNESPTSALFRARAGFFVDTFFTKVNNLMYPIMRAEGEEKEALGKELVDKLGKEIEPLLEDVGPFFGGSKTLTLAEALTAPFAIRYKAIAESDSGLFPKSVAKGLAALPNYSKWSKAVFAEEAVTHVFDGPKIVEGMASRIAKQKAEAK